MYRVAVGKRRTKPEDGRSGVASMGKTIFAQETGDSCGVEFFRDGPTFRL